MKKKSFLAEGVLSIFALLGAVLVYFLFENEALYVKRYLFLLGGGSLFLTGIDVYSKKTRLHPLSIFRKWVHYLSALFFALLMIVVILPIIVLQLILGPACMLIGLLAFIGATLAFFEEILLIDVVAVDIAKQGPSFWLCLIAFIVCALGIALNYFLHSRELYEKLYSLLGDALRGIRSPETI